MQLKNSVSVNMVWFIFPVVSVTMVEHRMQHELPVVQWLHAAIVPPAARAAVFDYGNAYDRKDDGLHVN